MRHPHRHTYHISRPLTFILLLLIMALRAQASDPAHYKQQTMLIIDSYYENDPWSNSIIVPVAKQLSDIDSVHCEIVHLNNCLISDSASYYRAEQYVLNKYANQHPQYVLMIGNTAFNLRDRIKAEWGDVPILLIARGSEYGPLDYYFSGVSNTHQLTHPLGKIRDLRDQYNFTLVRFPDLYQATIDMMMRMIPQMDELLFFADPMYHNRNLSYNISNYMAANYPQVKYRWVVGSEQNAPVFRNYLTQRHPHSGLLISTWFYQAADSTMAHAPTLGELNLISSSVNPFFSLRQSYIELGVLGGVYADYKKLIDHVDDVIGLMLKGESMRDIPFYEDNAAIPMVNYPQLKSYGIPEDLCPEGTKFVDKPPTFWQRNQWPIVIIGALLAILIYSLIRRSITLRRQARTISRQINFVNNMPIPFSKALVQYGKDGKIKDISYTMKNDAFDVLIKHNAIPDNPYLLFPSPFISEKVEQLLSTHKLVMFTYHFDLTDTYYEFIISEASLPDRRTAKTTDREIDIFAVDITHRYKMEADLKKTTEKLNITLSVAHMSAWQWDIKANTIIFDSKNHQIGMLDDRIAARNDKESQFDINDYVQLLHPDDMEALNEIRLGILSGTINTFSLQHRLRRAPADDNAYDWVEINGMVTDYYDDASPRMLTGSFLMITDRKEQEQQMADAIKRANESDQLKSAFLANMSHEIRTPLNAIIGFSNLLTETDDPRKKREFSDIINRNNDLLLSLINDVLDLAKIESNTIDISYSVVDVNSLIEAVANTVRMRVQSGVVLNTVLGADQCMAVLDQNRVQQVLINLLSNACKFTHRGSISFGYELTHDDHIYFFVKDTGIGLSDDQIASVFQRFYKADNFTQGTGLGLSICQSLVNKMQGEIGARSRGIGKGSEFWFTLPYRPATPDMEVEQEYNIDNFDLKGITPTPPPQHPTPTPQYPTPNTQHPTPNTQPPTPNTQHLTPNTPTILVAEDNDSNYRLIEHLLAPRFRLVHAIDGREAIDMFAAEHPDLIIMDINMPDIDGYEAVRIIRQTSPTVPIIGVTAYAYASDRRRILASGFNDYVSKPINPKLLYDAIDRFLPQ